MKIFQFIRMKSVQILLTLIFIFSPFHQLLQGQITKSEYAKTTVAEFPFTDKNLNKLKIKELIVHFWPDRKNIISINIYKGACDADWVVKYNENIPVYKSTNRKITYIYKKDNISYKVDNLVFYCDYLGGDQYGSIYTGFTEEFITTVTN